MSTTVEPLPHLRSEILEAARILRISRATLYERIREGLITTQKDGRRTFITALPPQFAPLRLRADPLRSNRPDQTGTPHVHLGRDHRAPVGI
jgi:hypothetical protein